MAISSHQSLMGIASTPSDLLPGTLELLLAGERAEFDRMVGVIQRVLGTTRRGPA